MSLKTSLIGRLRNTNLPLTNILHPLFEAVVNSIHSIDSHLKSGEISSLLDGIIRINILRTPQEKAFEETVPDIIGFEIIDNGIGFNEENYNSFQTLDSDYKIKLGCRGVGRLLWLKAFKKVSVRSVFKEGSEILTRTFDFDAVNDISNETIVTTPTAKIGTSIKLIDIRKDYTKYLRKTASTISKDLLEHCLWYFIRDGGAPEIFIMDGGEKISLQKEYEEMMLNATERASFSVKSKSFDITHVKLKSSQQNKHSIIYSAADRVVKEESLQGKIPGLYGFLNDGNDNFAYLCFLTSDYLTEKVNSERLDFNIAETVEGIFADTEISFTDIRNEALKTITKYLEQYLVENKQAGLNRLNDYVANKAPRYRPILGRLSDNEKIGDPKITDKELDFIALSLNGYRSRIIKRRS